MLKLSDFFQPFNLVNTLSIIGMLVFFDIFGTFIKKVFIKNSKINLETRLLDWLVGLSSFVFVWFLAGFVVEATRRNILISIVLMVALSLPGYLKSRAYKDFSGVPKSILVPFLLILPLLPPSIIKASLPPYYVDELNYHFISPFQMLFQIKNFWLFNGGTFMNVPRLMDNLYILTFSLTHTYSVVRFIQFMILPTSIFFSFVFIKKFFGKLPAFLFTLIFLSLPLGLPEISTIGYVDLPSHFFILIGFLLGLAFLMQDKKEYLILSIFFWGMSIGTKYSSLIPFAAFLIMVALVYWIKTKSLKIFLDKELILKSVIVVAISGGYWYIKNFVIYGNPIYPFLFHCWGKYGADCGQGSSFFGVWTTPINLNTIYPIIRELLPGNVFLYIALITAPLLIVAFSAKKMRLIAAGATAIFVFEMLALKYSSGFYARYQQHMEFFLILLISLLASVKFKNRLVKIIQYSILALVVISSSIAYFNNLGHLKTFQAEREYFLGKMNIYGWINYRLPKISGAILFCEKPHPTPIPITGFNIGEEAPYIRPYLMNCYQAEPDIQPADWKNFTKIAEIKKMNFWIISDTGCVSYNQSGADRLSLLTNLNNVIVCNSEKILPNLYHFDYTKLKNEKF